MDYKKILDQIVSGELKEYRVSPKDAFQFQLALRLSLIHISEPTRPY